MILVYSPKFTSRLSYALQLLLTDLLGFEFSVTKNTGEFISYSGPKFSYGKNPADDDSLHFAAAGLLFEKGIGSPEVQVGDHEGDKIIFQVFERNSAMPYDPFSAAFFMVSRYEEFMPYRKDQYGRFTAIESIAYKNGFLDKPVVNIWATRLGNILVQRYPYLKPKKHQYRFLPTYDIDQAWSFAGKGFVRTNGAYIKALIRGDFENILQRTRVLTGLEPDPFDTFDYQLELQKRYKLRSVYFFLFAAYGEYDKNITVTNSRFRQLIKRIADYADVGIHPSYASNSRNELLRQEVREFSKVLNREITRSRQHFLKLHIPDTYQNLINCDIVSDYTMGFAARPGFRAGICLPYQFYDLDMETVMPLTVYPFTVMDGTLKDYMQLSPDAAIEVIHGLIHEVRKVGGIFSSLWHNDSLSDTGGWAGWRRVYEELVKRAAE